ncbi:hypothetical protein [Pseudactinotalea terrae]|uniref:hypothetical protein n=1 Tax=Pseudactinotalea terrae TaxID=1743262 RepID=UPI0012E2F7CE|nr:hypothetical protein [Pseudactinotalea terrae]
MCSVPIEALPGLVEHHPVVDLGSYEFGRRQVGKLLSANLERDGSVTGSIELAVPQRDIHRPGMAVYRCVAAGFGVAGGQRVTAHLRTSVLAATPGAVDIELG